MHATCPAHVDLFDLIILAMPEQIASYEASNYAVFSNFSLVCPILIPLRNRLHQVSEANKNTVKIIILYISVPVTTAVLGPVMKWFGPFKP
jgi:hypothetical protein